MMFSIAVPAYKGKFLKECIESILIQTFKDFELIIVNDCSPELIAETVSQFNDVRIRYFENETNIGGFNLVNNWNNCLEKARGDYFVMMGDDDKMEFDYLEEFVKLIGKYPDLDVYHCRSFIIDENSKPFMLTQSWPEYESVYENIWHREIGMRKQYISDFVYNTAKLKGNGGFFYLPYAWGSDDITSFIACGEKGIAHTNKPVFNYRSSVFTISYSTGSHDKLLAFVLREKWFREFLETTPKSEIDKLFYEDLKQKLLKRVKDQKISTMANALRDHFFNSFYVYIKQWKAYRITYKEIILALYKAFKLKSLS